MQRLVANQIDDALTLHPRKKIHSIAQQKQFRFIDKFYNIYYYSTRSKNFFSKEMDDMLMQAAQMAGADRHSFSKVN